ncbi:MAG TPA: hypothetical protein VM600_04475 [Actinomycetota bacterium]|nr:hypothetical protein [Actinomycetota bacterium]
MQTWKRSIALAATIVLGGILPTTSANASTVNLIPNPSFESHYLPQEVVAVAFNQPGIPVGWAVEGVSALFDHTPQNPKKGQYAAAISGSYSGPRKDCSAGCVDVPGSAERDTLYQTYSVQPSWRTVQPVPVKSGKMYRFSSWIRLAIPKDATGAVTKIRWFDSTGLQIGASNGPSLIGPTNGANYATFAAGNYKDNTTDWTYRAVNVTAPSGATGAIVVLSYTDDFWIGQAVFDQVCLAEKATSTTQTICDTTFA